MRYLFGRRIKLDVLHYTDRSKGEYRDLRQIELGLGRYQPKRYRFPRWVRLSLNGQYRSGKRTYDYTRSANPGFSVGTERVLINFSHHRRHCWHLSLEAFKRGITLSYGRSI